MGGGLSLMCMVTAGTARPGDPLPDGFPRHCHRAPGPLCLSLCPHGISSSGPFHMAWASHSTGCSLHGGWLPRGRKRKCPASFKSYPWGWHSVTCAVSYWSKPSQNLLALKGRRERDPPSPDGRAARSHWQGTCGRELSLQSSLENRIDHRG